MSGTTVCQFSATVKCVADAKVLSYIHLRNGSGTCHRWLYRADTRRETNGDDHTHNVAGGLRAETILGRDGNDSQCNIAFKKEIGVSSFLEELKRHLDKIQTPCKTALVSLTPKLEWAIHRTGQKSRSSSQFFKEGESGLAIIDTEKLRTSQDTIILRVSDVISYSQEHGQENLFSATVRGWAQNCEEYVVINSIPSEAVAKWVPWEVLFTEHSTERLLVENFQYWYTLGKLRQNCSLIPALLPDVAWRVLTLATAIVECGSTNASYGYKTAIEAIAGGSDWGWGYENANNTVLLVDAANICLEIQTLQRKLQGLSVRSSID